MKSTFRAWHTRFDTPSRWLEKRPSTRVVWDYLPDSRPEPTTPTTALPGSALKVAVMLSRRMAGVTLFHANDGQARPVDLTTAFASMMRQHYVHGIYRTPGGKWRAYPYNRRTKKRVHLGYYSQEHEAVSAVFKWEEKLAKESN